MRAALLGFVLLSGCAVIDPEAARLAAVDRTLAEAIHASRAPAGEQKAALSRAQAAFVAEASPVNRLRLAALAALLPPPLRDDARALELLEPLADASAAGPGRLAVLLQQHVLERQRLAREAERAGREAERSSRERQQAERERDKREEALKAQLEALRGIERGILEREEKLRRKK
ncbi:MAG: hypothetical protein ACT4P4_00410 [Betaproteobacteria bacterium]